MMRTVSGRRAWTAEAAIAKPVPTLLASRIGIGTEATARGVDAPGHPVDERPAGRVGILAGQRELDHAARHTAPMELGRHVVTVAGVHTRNRVAFFEVRTRQVHRASLLLASLGWHTTIGVFPAARRTDPPS